jgi:CheY-like chemotaxis protein
VNQKLALRMLQKLNCQVEIAANGREAVNLFTQSSFECIFMDCQMPILDGFEATAEIRRLEKGERRIPIVAITANAMAGDREKCLDSGMDDYISKPVQMSDLQRVLNHRVAMIPTGAP